MSSSKLETTTIKQKTKTEEIRIEAVTTGWLKNQIPIAFAINDVYKGLPFTWNGKAKRTEPCSERKEKLSSTVLQYLFSYTFLGGPKS